jgi:hypothetical protein
MLSYVFTLWSKGWVTSMYLHCGLNVEFYIYSVVYMLTSVFKLRSKGWVIYLQCSLKAKTLHCILRPPSTPSPPPAPARSAIWVAPVSQRPPPPQAMWDGPYLESSLCTVLVIYVLPSSQNSLTGHSCYCLGFFWALTRPYFSLQYSISRNVSLHVQCFLDVTAQRFTYC